MCNSAVFVQKLISQSTLLCRRPLGCAGYRESCFVRAVDAGNGSKSMSKPGGVYLATERLKNLFGGVAGVLLVDYGHSCLRGEDVRSYWRLVGSHDTCSPFLFLRASTGKSWQI